MKQVFIIIICIAAGILIGLHSQNKVYLKIQNECDSLKSENFIKDLKLMRFEYIIENLSEDTTTSTLLNKIIKETE